MSSLCHFVFICFLEFSLRQMMCGVASAADGSVCVRGVHWDSEEISTCSVTATEQSSAATQSSWKLCATNFTSTTLAHFGSSVSPQLFCQPVLNVQKIHCTGFACPPRLWQLVKPVAPDKKARLCTSNSPLYDTCHPLLSIGSAKITYKIFFERYCSAIPKIQGFFICKNHLE